MYMPILPAANSWLMPPQSSRKLLPIELSSQRRVLSSLERRLACPALLIGRLRRAVAGALLHPPAACA